MQTSQRKIPTTGGKDGKPANYHWTQMLPHYEAELGDFQRQVATLKRGETITTGESQIKPLPAASFKLLSGGVEATMADPSSSVSSGRAR